MQLHTELKELIITEVSHMHPWNAYGVLRVDILDAPCDKYTPLGMK